MQATLLRQEIATTNNVNNFNYGISQQGVCATDEQWFKSSCNMQAKLVVIILHEIQ